jgi:ADP-heptose:LPS heptosyltransferase
VEWGLHKWIHTSINEQYKNTIFINTVDYCFCESLDFQKIKNENICFVGFEPKQYEYFVDKTGIFLPFLQVANFMQLAVILNSCKLFIGSLSAPLALAHACHIDQVVGFPKTKKSRCEQTELKLMNLWNHYHQDFPKL